LPRGTAEDDVEKGCERPCSPQTSLPSRADANPVWFYGPTCSCVNPEGVTDRAGVFLVETTAYLKEGLAQMRPGQGQQLCL